MTTDPMPSALIVPELLRLSADRQPASDPDDTLDVWVRRLIRKRRDFGITRVGAITRLDRIGIPVVQVARPLSLSNAVSQGKGRTWLLATASALMESIESWAGENIAPSRLKHASFQSHQPDVHALYKLWLTDDAPDDWALRELKWLEGWDLFTGRMIPVPATLVDTIYTLPSPHPAMFPRTTTGLAAGRTLIQAIIHASLEILERDAIAAAHRIPFFFDLHQIQLPDMTDGPCSDILAKIREADLLYGIWQAPAAHAFPVYWCHLMELGPPQELVPLPSEGFGCDITHERAVAKAILEACQARATAISGAREDLTRLHYPGVHDRAQLDEWREQLSAPRRSRIFPADGTDEELSGPILMERVLEGLRQAGALAAIVVPLLCDQDSEIHVVRLVAPPLRLNPRS
jgi:ribosomal protein S12 methylthiotransferase accessory factor